MNTKNNFSPQQHFVLGAVLFIVFIIMAAIYAFHYSTGKAKIVAYMNSPPCSSIPQPDGADCRRLITTTIVKVFTARAGHAQEHLAQFQLPEGTLLEAEIFDKEFWQHLEPGERVIAEIWHAQITRVKTPDGNERPTVENPEWNRPNISDGILPVVVTFGIFGMLFMITALFRWRKTQKSQNII